MPKKSPGSRANQTGKDFERDIARRLRQIYDPESLISELETATAKTRPRLLLQSSVRRGDQRRGAREPDIVTPSPWWLELQCKSPKSGGRTDGTDKLDQAERDIAAREHGKLGTQTDWHLPAVVERRKGSPRVWVTMRLGILVAASGYGPLKLAMFGKTITTISWEDFENILRAEKARHDRQSDNGPRRVAVAGAS